VRHRHHHTITIKSIIITITSQSSPLRQDRKQQQQQQQQTEWGREEEEHTEQQHSVIYRNLNENTMKKERRGRTGRIITHTMMMAWRGGGRFGMMMRKKIRLMNP
jgi:hypothetical protein